jgi:TonB family protein
MRLAVLTVLSALAAPWAAWPAEGPATLESARAHLSGGDYQAALDEARDLLYDHPQDVGALYVAGVAALHLDQLNEAEKYLEKVERIAPDAPDVDYQLAVVLLRLADDYFARGKDKIAIDLCDEALQHVESELQRSPDHTEAISLRASAYKKAGRESEATAAFEAWASTDPDNPTVLEELARLYAEQNRIEDARRLLPKLPPGSKQLAAATFLVARADYIDGRPTEGRVLLEQLRDLPAPVWQVTALDALDALSRGQGHDAAAALLRLLGQEPPQEELEIVTSAYHEQYVALTRAEASKSGADPGGENDSLPKLDTRVSAHYPVDARRYGVEGEVLLLAVVEPDGSVGEVTVIRTRVSNHPTLHQSKFEAEAVKAVKQWHYVAARRDGQPVAFPITISVRFSQ